jgi:hypothetical protein
MSGKTSLIAVLVHAVIYVLILNQLEFELDDGTEGFKSRPGSVRIVIPWFGAKRR